MIITIKTRITVLVTVIILATVVITRIKLFMTVITINHVLRTYDLLESNNKYDIVYKYK